MANIPTSLKALSSGNEGLSRSDSFRIDPNLIQIEEGFNLREPGQETDAHIDRIYRAMKAGAFIPPVDVSVVSGEIVARDGHCRRTAAIRLRKEMPEYTLECRQLRGNEVDAVLHMLGTGSGSKPLTPLEQGKGYLRLVNMGQKPSEIASRLGVSRVTIDNGLQLAEAPVEVQKMIVDGEVSSTTAREAVKKGKDGIAALKDAVADKKKTPAAKKKVTAKNLKGTAAEKGKKTETDPGSITITIKKEVAKATAEFIRGFGGEDEPLKEMAATLETALM